MAGCPVCGSSDGSCGLTTSHLGVEIKEGHVRPSTGGQVVRVERADGRLFSFQAGDVQEFLAANPESKIVPGRGEPAPTQQEEAATAALNTISSNSTVAELKAFAEKNGIDLVGASVKADILARIEGASADVEKGEAHQT